MAGALLSSLSCLSSSFAHSLEVLYFTLGVMFGCAACIMQVVNQSIVPFYFHKRLSMAIGITMTGVGFGLFVFSALNEYLLRGK